VKLCFLQLENKTSLQFNPEERQRILSQEILRNKVLAVDTRFVLWHAMSPTEETTEG
jgi:hypothetical protein